MALSKETQVYWFNTTNYVKPISIVIDEIWENEEWFNLYEVQVIVVFYTDSTKAYRYENKQFTLKDLLEADLSLPSIYGKIMLLPEFEWYIFV